MTAIYSVLHMLVDGVCAFAMFGTFIKQEQGYFYVLIYNFCAFALQMPLGAALDLLHARSGKRFSFAVAGMGVVLTLIGAITHPAILGTGNALFHIGGGVGTIHEDVRKGWRGRGLGVFVAPGALGLYLGGRFAGNGAGVEWLCGTAVFMVIICVWAGCRLRHSCVQNLAAGASADGGIQTGNVSVREKGDMPDQRTGTAWLTVCLFLIVVLRSYIGMAVTFSWKTTILATVLSTLAIVLGKAAGGFLAAQFGYLRTAVVSLSAAAVFYLFSGFMPAGVAALFLFNMTMPVTLYLLVRRLPQLPGFSFGLLTFGLFLGFLPEYYGLHTWQNSSMIGVVGSLVSLLILVAGMYRGESGMSIDLVRMFGISLMLTLVVELAIAFMLGLRTGKGIRLAALVNVLTNPPAVLCNWLCRLYLPGYRRIPTQLVIEAVVIIVEALIYCRFAGDKQRMIKRPVLLAVVANGCSWLLGIVIRVL